MSTASASAVVGQPEGEYKLVGLVTKITFEQPTNYWYVNEYQLAKLLLNESGSVEEAIRRLKFVEEERESRVVTTQ